MNQVRRRELRDDLMVVVGGEASGCAKYDDEWFVAMSVGTGGVLERGMVNALPMSLRVSLRTRTFMDGAMAGTWWLGICTSPDCDFRKAEMRRSSTMVLSSRMASSTGSFGLERRMLPDDDLNGRTRSERDRPCPLVGSGLRVSEGEREVYGRW